MNASLKSLFLASKEGQRLAKSIITLAKRILQCDTSQISGVETSRKLEIESELNQGMGTNHPDGIKKGT